MDFLFYTCLVCHWCILQVRFRVYDETVFILHITNNKCKTLLLGRPTFSPLTSDTTAVNREETVIHLLLQDH